MAQFYILPAKRSLDWETCHFKNVSTARGKHNFRSNGSFPPGSEPFDPDMRLPSEFRDFVLYSSTTQGLLSLDFYDELNVQLVSINGTRVQTRPQTNFRNIFLNTHTRVSMARDFPAYKLSPFQKAMDDLVAWKVRLIRERFP